LYEQFKNIFSYFTMVCPKIQKPNIWFVVLALILKQQAQSPKPLGLGLHCKRIIYKKYFLHFIRMFQPIRSNLRVNTTCQIPHLGCKVKPLYNPSICKKHLID